MPSIAALRAFDPPIVLIAGGRDKGIDLAALAPVVAERAVAAVLIGESGRTLEARVPGRRAGPHRAGRRPRGRRSAGPMPSPATRARDDAPGGRATGDRAAQPGRRQLRHVRGLRRPGPGVQGGRRGARRGPVGEGGPMNLAPPIPRLERARRDGDPPTDRRRPSDRRRDGQPDAGQEPGRRGPPRAPPGRLRDPGRRRRPDRDRHPDGLLVVGAQGLPVAGRRHVRDRRAADPVGDPGPRRDGRDDAGRLPLPPPRVGPAVRRRHRPARPRLRARASTSSSAARRAGSSSGRCRPSTRPSSPSSPWSSISPTGSPSAAAGSAASGAGPSRS